MDLKIDADRVRQAADSCPDAKRVLKTLFPEAFRDARPQYKQLGFRPGTEWKHVSDSPHYIYVGDSPELGKAMGTGSVRDVFFSIQLSCHDYVYTTQDASNLEVIKL